MNKLQVIGRVPMVAAAVLIFAGCGGGARTGADADDKMIVRFANAAEPSDLDPHAVSGLPEYQAVTCLLEGLTRLHPRTLEPLPGQAESWEISDDGLVYTFHLRENAKWSNGDPVTARDFVRSWRRILLPSFGSEYSYMLHAVVGARAFNRGEITDFGQTGFKALDERTVQITLAHPTSYFLKLLIHQSWMPVHLPTLEKFGGAERKGTRWTRAENFVGNGALVMREWVPQQHIIMEPNPHYWDRSSVKLDELHVLPIDNADTEERMYRTGQVDITYSLPLSKIDTYRDESPESVDIAPAFVGAYFRVNVTRPAFADSRVRRALGMALDREAIARQVWRGTKFPAYSFTPPGVEGFEPGTPFRDDVTAARALLAEAGYPDGEGFPPFDILYPTSDNGRSVCEALQQMWRANLGIDVRLHNQEWKVYLDSMNTLDYDVTLGIWGGDYLDPMTFLDTLASSSGNNRTGWGSAAYDQLLDEVSREQNEAARLALFARMEQIIGAEVPVIPIYHYSKVRVVRPTIRGWYANALDVHPLHLLWIDDSVGAN